METRSPGESPGAGARHRIVAAIRKPIEEGGSFGAMPTAVPLTLNEVRENLSKFAVEWKGANYERGQAQGFWREFFACFGIGGQSAVLYERS
ncbi:hypothetical protein [Microbacterium wangruii]|uniref:hypothetical protein n=1 Tax=Microbacterium wangruii TaxID=3049073 RepID=UPI00256EC92A|nr:hypothetical protein [Microbacterium sp. zg-Y1211]MDL5488256.1 hypothetical protein [Microbacterium sp. zg-Y1211]